MISSIIIAILGYCGYFWWAKYHGAAAYWRTIAALFWVTTIFGVATFYRAWKQIK